VQVIALQDAPQWFFATMDRSARDRQGSMIRKKKGFLSKLRDRFPVSRAEARRRAHTDLIKAARIQLTKGVMLGMTHALAQRHEPIEEPEKHWWRAETVKWETIWRMINEATVDLDDFQRLSDLHKVAEAAFNLYEQMAVNAVTSLCEVPTEVLHEEAVRWRETGTLIASLHRHCVMDKLNDARFLPSSKNPAETGITDLKEG